MKVRVLNKEEMKRIIESNKLNKSNIRKYKKNYMFISINDSGVNPLLESNDVNVLSLSFDDIGDSEISSGVATKNSLVPFNEEMAEKIVSFVLKNRDVKNCVIHCHGGISRSGAVGEFINELFGEVDYNHFVHDNPRVIPSPFVKRILESTYRSVVDSKFTDARSRYYATRKPTTVNYWDYDGFDINDEGEMFSYLYGHYGRRRGEY